MIGTSPVLPYSKRYETFCPFCGTVGTEWHPVERWGKCHRCGKTWRMERPKGGRG